MQIPKITGPIPVTNDSHPLMASRCINLEDFGYTEKEYFISGFANIYKWDADITFYQWDANCKVEIVTPDFPYTTRILVRRPINSKKFSGNVIVEPIHTNLGGLDSIWAMCHEYFIKHNDIWVGITQPATILTLKKFDPVRYGPLYGTNDVLIWDIISQIGAILKSQSPDNPLNGFNVKFLFATGYSQTCGLIITYINAIHESATLDNGKPIYDGYLPAAIGVRPQTSRNTVKPCNVPVIQALTQSEIVNASVTQRPDGDELGDCFRRYEVPGATHVYKRALTFGASPDDLARLGMKLNSFNSSAPFLENDFPFNYFLDGAFSNLELWVRDGIPPPRADRIATIKNKDQKISLLLDDFGNAISGVRSPYVDVPVVTYHTGFPEPGAGYKIPFVDALLKKLYRNHEGYLREVVLATEKLRQEHWVTEEDKQKIIKEAEQSNVLCERKITNS